MSTPTLREEVAEAMYSNLNIARTPWGKQLPSMHEAWLCDADAALAVVRERVAALLSTPHAGGDFEDAISDVLDLLDGKQQ